jgi:hypothetical protein
MSNSNTLFILFLLPLFLANFSNLGRLSAVENTENEPTAFQDWPKHVCLVSNGSWEKYFTEAPEILLVNSMSLGASELLQDEQRFVNQLLGAQFKSYTADNMTEFEAELAKIKDSVIARGTGGDYSPRLILAVEGTLMKITLEDADRLLYGLQRTIDLWTRKTIDAESRNVPASRIQADSSYLQEVQQANTRLSGILAEFQQAKTDQAMQRKKLLEEWQRFAAIKLPTLDEYVQSNIVERFSPSDEGKYVVPNRKDVVWLYRCTFGDLDLYFALSSTVHEQHPFKLIDLGQIE